MSLRDEENLLAHELQSDQISTIEQYFISKDTMSFKQGKRTSGAGKLNLKKKKKFFVSL